MSQINRPRGFFQTLFFGASTTISLIAINVVLFFVFSIIIALKPEYIYYIDLQPALILQGKALWTLITSMFMHQGGFHLLVNMFSLFFIGGFCERLVGKKRFIGLYLVSGIIASIVFVFFAFIGQSFSLGPQIFGDVNDLAAGASGALFGLLGLLAVIIPYHRVYLIVGPLVVLILQTVLYSFIPESISTFFLIGMNILMFVSLFALFSSNKSFRRFAIPVSLPIWITPIVAIVPLVLISFFVRLPIGNTAHFGGLVIGLFYGVYLLLKYPRKVIMLRRFLGS